MKIIGCDFHPSYQQIAMLDQGTGEFTEMRLSHQAQGEEARKFYSALHGPVRVGLEASGQSQWFEQMLAELGREVWIGGAAKIRASCERKQKTDRRDAALLLKLLAEDRFPRIWVPTAAERDDRQLLLHRHKVVRMRTQVKRTQRSSRSHARGARDRASSVSRRAMRCRCRLPTTALMQLRWRSSSSFLAIRPKARPRWLVS